MLENLKFFRMNNEQKDVRFLIYERGLVLFFMFTMPYCCEIILLTI